MVRGQLLFGVLRAIPCCNDNRPGIGGGIMLVLSRKKDETIVIGENIVVTVVDVRGDKVRLGIAAPREVTVHRREVYEAIKRSEGAKEVCPDNAPSIDVTPLFQPAMPPLG
jgi:carbon storage regulator